jgi:hypothetical protein
MDIGRPQHNIEEETCRHRPQHIEEKVTGRPRQRTHAVELGRLRHIEEKVNRPQSIDEKVLRLAGRPWPKIIVEKIRPPVGLGRRSYIDEKQVGRLMAGLGT